VYLKFFFFQAFHVTDMLPLWLPVCFQPKTSSLRMFLHGNISGTVSAEELFKSSKDSASLQVCYEKIFWISGFGFFVSDVLSGIVLGLFGPFHLALGPNC